MIKYKPFEILVGVLCAFFAMEIVLEVFRQGFGGVFIFSVIILLIMAYKGGESK